MNAAVLYALGASGIEIEASLLAEATDRQM